MEENMTKNRAISAEELTKRRQAGSLEKLGYESTKQKVLYLEKTNFSHIFILKTNDDWYKIMSHSALIFTRYVWPIAKDKLGLTRKDPKVIADSDFRDKAPIGIVSRNRLEDFVEPIMAVGAKKVEVSGSNSDLVTAYRLERGMSEEEFWKIKKDEDELWGKANTIITPKAVYPNLSIDIQEASTQIYFVARKMQRTDREFFGAEMLGLTKKLAKGVIMAEKGFLPWETYFDMVPEILAGILANISLLASFRLIDNKVLIRLNDALLKIEDDLKVAKKNYEKRKSNKTARESKAK